MGSALGFLPSVLRRLPQRERIAWTLRYVEDESLEMVATACGCSLATAKRWIAAADAEIRKYVQFEAEEGRA